MVEPTGGNAEMFSLNHDYQAPITVPVHDIRGSVVGSVTVQPADFGGRINKQLLHEVVLMYLANQRAGTHSTLRRGEVAGSTKKLFRQKGTGNARAGTKRTNKRRGGGTAKGPKPRDYEYHLPKKAVRLATRMAILSKFVDGEVVLLDELTMAAPKTKELCGIFKAIKIGKKTLAAKNDDGTETVVERDVTLLDRTVLLGTATYDVNVYKSGRNIDGVRVLPVHEFNAYSVLKHKLLVLTRAALEALVAPKLAAPTAAPAASNSAPAAATDSAPRLRRGRAGRLQKRKALTPSAGTRN